MAHIVITTDVTSDYNYRDYFDTKNWVGLNYYWSNKYGSDYMVSREAYFDSLPSSFNFVSQNGSSTNHVITVAEFMADATATGYFASQQIGALKAYWGAKYPNGYVVIKNLEYLLGSTFKYTAVEDATIGSAQGLAVSIKSYFGLQYGQNVNPNIGAYNGNTGVSGPKIEYVDRYIDRNAKDVPAKTNYTPYIIAFCVLLFLALRK